jgi:hypothetical protein
MRGLREGLEPHGLRLFAASCRLKTFLEYHVEAFVQGVVEHVGGGEGRIPVQHFSP